MAATQAAAEASFYRPEALAAYRQGERSRGRSQWLDPSLVESKEGGPWFFILVALALSSVFAMALIEVDERVMGEAVVRLGAGEDPGSASLEVLVPDARRADFAVGQDVGLELVDYPAASLGAVVTAIGDEVVLAEKGHLVLGDGAPIRNSSAGPLTRLVARLSVSSDPAPPLSLRDGMRGRAEVVVASKSMLAYLFPFLERGDLEGEQGVKK